MEDYRRQLAARENSSLMSSELLLELSELRGGNEEVIRAIEIGRSRPGVLVRMRRALVTTSITQSVPATSSRMRVAQLLGTRGGLPRSNAELVVLAMNRPSTS